MTLTSDNQGVIHERSSMDLIVMSVFLEVDKSRKYKLNLYIHYCQKALIHVFQEQVCAKMTKVFTYVSTKNKREPRTHK